DLRRQVRRRVDQEALVGLVVHEPERSHALVQPGVLPRLDAQVLATSDVGNPPVLGDPQDEGANAARRSGFRLAARTEEARPPQGENTTQKAPPPPRPALYC